MSLSRSRPLALLAAFAAACTPATPSLSDAQRAAVEEEARQASVALVDALNAHDADAILAFYALDDDFTQVACTSFIRGGEGFRAITRSLHAGYRDAVYRMDIRRVRVLGPDEAVVFLSGTMLAELFVTRVLQRGDDGRLRVVWEHESWPGCPETAAPHPGTGPGAAAAVGEATDTTSR